MMKTTRYQQAGTVLDDVGDAVGAMLSTGADALADVAPDLEEIAGTAIDTVAATGRFGVRLVIGTVRFVARHPREVLIGIGIVAACLTVARLLSSSQSEPDTA